MDALTFSRPMTTPIPASTALSESVINLEDVRFILAQEQVTLVVMGHNVSKEHAAGQQQSRKNKQMDSQLCGS